MADTETPPEPDKRRIGAYLRLLRPHLGRWTLATCVLFVGAALNLSLPQAVRLAIDDALSQGNTEALDILVLGASGLFLAIALFAFWRIYLVIWIGSRIVADLRRRTFGHLLKMPPGFFDVRSSGELVTRLTSDIHMISHAVAGEISVALRSGTIVVVGLSFLIWTDVRLTALMLITFPPIVFGALWARKHIRKRARVIQDEIAEAGGRLKEAVIGIETVQVFNAESREVERYGDHVENIFDNATSLAIIRGGFVSVVQLCGYIALALILWFGGAQVIDGTITGGELTAFLLYTMMVTSSLMGLAQVWTNLERAMAASGRVFDLLDEEPLINDNPDAIPLESPRGAISFDGVSFAYPTRADITVLENVSFTIDPGQTVALVGRSGAGKSTISALLHRFYEPVKGIIRVDDIALDQVELVSLRAALATVHQEPMLFSGTILENIAYGAPGASEEAVREAAKEAGIADFIEELPELYDTEVGERGVRLSGGQRQRIAIARAMLADPVMLVLDEATSHLDTVNEAWIQESLSRLMHGRTTLIIAHRLSTVRNADRILVVDQGRIVQQGTHEALLAQGGVYGELIRNQELAA